MCPPCQGSLKGQAEIESREGMESLGQWGTNANGPGRLWGGGLAFSCPPGDSTPRSLVLPGSVPILGFCLTLLASPWKHRRCYDVTWLQKSSPFLWFWGGGRARDGRVRASFAQNLGLSRRGHVLFNKSLIIEGIFKS